MRFNGNPIEEISRHYKLSKGLWEHNSAADYYYVSLSFDIIANSATAIGCLPIDGWIRSSEQFSLFAFAPSEHFPSNHGSGEINQKHTKNFLIWCVFNYDHARILNANPCQKGP
jgi:hypothetical protein